MMSCLNTFLFDLVSRDQLSQSLKFLEINSRLRGLLERASICTCGDQQGPRVSRYPAFVDGEAGAYGVTFPDLPGIVAMGETMGDALVHAEEALRDYVTETERDGAQVAEASPMESVTPPEGSVLVAIG